MTIKENHRIDVPNVLASPCISLYFQEIGDSTDIQLKIQILETKLAEALEENKMYRAQQKRYPLHSEA